MTELKWSKKQKLFNKFWINLLSPELYHINENQEKFLKNFDDCFNLNEFDDSILNKDFIKTYSQNSIYQDNLKWRQILISLYPELNYSGIYLKTKCLFQWIKEMDSKKLAKFLKKNFYGSFFKKASNVINENYLVSQKALDQFLLYCNYSNKVYYDFETISLPLSVMENTEPYQQIVNQISIIKNIDNCGIDECKNLVFDPLKLSLKMFKTIIDLIYVDPQKNAKYIVYNKTFENTRLKEMACLIDEVNYYEKVINIIENTIDLADFFDIRKNMIIARSLKGSYSIKKVIELVDQAFLKKAKATSYKQIEKVQNGIICQNLSIQRFLNLVKNEVWEFNKKLMKIYCENDVRSMIAVEYLIKKIIITAKKEEKIIEENNLINAF